MGSDGATPIDWESVSSVRITLVMSTPENNTALKDQKYWLNGKEQSVGGKKIFRAFTTTIALRNKDLDS